MYSLSAGFFFRRRGSASSDDLDGSKARDGTPEVTILFVPVTVPLPQVTACWAEDCDTIILRHCPVCKRDSIVGHGRRRKQAHDEHHDWIGIHRGRCAGCGKTFTFLPVFSLPYTHYSLLARCQAWWRRAGEHCSWEEAAPKCKAPDRLPDASTVRRWSSGVDDSPSARSFLRQMMVRVAQRLAFIDSRQDEAAFLSWLTPVLELRRPLRL